jgi:hypothetical protein
VRSALRTLAALCAAFALLGAAGTTVDTIGGTRAAIVMPDASPVGSVILVPGGSTLLRIDAVGGTPSDNFVIRVRSAFTDAGYAIAYVEDPGDLRPVIARMRRIARPVFLLATSNGTAVAAATTARLGDDGPDGIVLTSTVTITSRRFGYTAASVDLSRIHVPVLFVHNRNDGCSASPPAGIAPLMARFPAGSDVTRSDFSSETTPNDPCGPLSPHGYLGIEDDVTATILSWMRAHSGPAKRDAASREPNPNG